MPNDIDDSYRYEPINMPPEEEPPPPGWWHNRWLPIGLALVFFAVALILINRPPPVKVVIDLPALMGKTPAEVATVLGAPAEKAPPSPDAASTPPPDDAIVYHAPRECSLHLDAAGKVVRIECLLPDSCTPDNFHDWMPEYGFTHPRYPYQQMALGSRYFVVNWRNMHGCDLMMTCMPGDTATTLTIAPAGTSQ